MQYLGVARASSPQQSLTELAAVLIDALVLSVHISSRVTEERKGKRKDEGEEAFRRLTKTGKGRIKGRKHLKGLQQRNSFIRNGRGYLTFEC